MAGQRPIGPVCVTRGTGARYARGYAPGSVGELDASRGAPCKIHPPRREISQGGYGKSRGKPDLVFVSLSFVLMHPIRTDYQRQLDVANEVFAPLHVAFFVEDEFHSDPFAIESLLAGGTRIAWDTRFDSEMNWLARQRFELRGRIKVFFAKWTDGDAAFSIPRALDRESCGSLGERIYISDWAVEDTLAHELGHVLLNHRSGRDHSPDKTNMMAGYGEGRIGRNWTPQQARQIYENALGVR